MKANDKKYFIVSLFIVLLSLGVGYAIFSDTLNIAGTATVTGNFDVEFTTATVVENEHSESATAVISADKNTLTIDAPDLKQPGAQVTVSVVVTNVGNINAELLSVNLTGDDDADITVTYPTFPVGTVVEPGMTYPFDVVIEWDINSTASEKTLNFTADLNYQQEV